MDITSYCFFIGMGRSGSSVLGAVLDAHQQVVFGNDFTYLPGVCRNKMFTKDEVINRTFKHTQDQNRHGRWSGKIDGGKYPQQLPGQVKKSMEGVKVLGSKYMSSVTMDIAKDTKGKLDVIREVLGPIKVVHVIRNPFDLYAAALKSDKPATHLVGSTANCTAMIEDDLKEGELLRVYFEDLISAPTAVLKTVLAFLDLPVFTAHMSACYDHIRGFKVHDRKAETKWSYENIVKVAGIIRAHEYLERYAL